MSGYRTILHRFIKEPEMANIMNPKDELVRHLHFLRNYNLNDSHSGIGSVRFGNRLWITPRHASAETLAAGDLLDGDLSGTVEGLAPMTTPLHQIVYKQNNDLHALLQSHGPYTVAMTLDAGEFNPAQMAGSGLSRVPVLTIPPERFEREAGNALAEVLGRQPIAVVRGHGVFAAAATVELAYRWTTALEHAAHTAFIAKLAGKL